ncbi:hypothetical protein [Chryseobacterium gambrini]|uniref:hypothetical protein n=1 Tax=Chryseobacterium gambrini TaxID=373672 RepID=UPI0022F3B996|nr:hypothetical protein [Chryseobacterium gambrini]WBX95844.1 hypothetical protein PE065_13275 [Chryseobacterium gambrini]
MKLPKFLLLIFLFVILMCNKGTKENPIEDTSTNWGKLTHLKYSLYQSDFLGKKKIVEKITFYNPEEKKYYSFYTDQLYIKEPGKSVILTYSSVIDLPSYKELEGTYYAVDKNRVYFLDTTNVKIRIPLYDPDPKLFIKHFSYNKAQNKYYLPEQKRFKNYQFISRNTETIAVKSIQWATTDRPNYILAEDYEKYKNSEDLVNHCFFLDTQNISIQDFPKEITEQLQNGKSVAFTGKFYKTKKFDDVFPNKIFELQRISRSLSYKPKDEYYRVFVYDKIKNK